MEQLMKAMETALKAITRFFNSAAVLVETMELKAAAETPQAVKCGLPVEEEKAKPAPLPLGHPCTPVFTEDTPVKEEPVEEEEAPVETPPEQDEEPEPDRKAIKKRLRELSVAFASTAHTTTLVKLLEGAEKMHAQFLADQKPLEEPVKEEKKEVTREEASKALMELASKKGHAEGKKILSALGGAKLGDLNPIQYGAIVAKCKEALDA